MIGPFYVGEVPHNPLTFTVSNNDGSVADLSQYQTIEVLGDDLPAGDVTVASAADGLLSYKFTDPFVDPGSYDIQFALITSDGGVDYTPRTIFEVYARSTEEQLFVSRGDVYSMTGQAVSDEEIMRAQYVIEMATNLDLTTVPNLRKQTIKLLKFALAYQAVWMADQPDMFTRSDISAYNQDGASATLTPSSFTLAPLAKRALKRAKNRTTSVRMDRRDLRAGSWKEDHEGHWVKLW